jgi:hypothetical protein
MAQLAIVYNPKRAPVTVLGVTVPAQTHMGVSVTTSGQFQGLSLAGLFIIPAGCHIEEIQDAGHYILKSAQMLQSRSVAGYTPTV